MNKPDLFINRGAEFSDCGLYRHLLFRIWDAALPPLIFVMLNPSTADEVEDDPTIRRCIAYAKREGAGGVWVANLFTFRATKPKDLRAAENPIGPHAYEAYEHCFDEQQRSGATIVAAWGSHGAFLSQDQAFWLHADRRKAKVRCLGLTKERHPRHPLYVKGDQPLEPYHSWSRI